MINPSGGRYQICTIWSRTAEVHESDRRDRRRARGRGGVATACRPLSPAGCHPRGTGPCCPGAHGPSNSRTWSHSTGMNGSAQASGRSGRQLSRRLPNTASSLTPAMVRTAMPSVRASSEITWSRSARVRPRSVTRASASGLSGAWSW
jgi:hypothetical protein